MTSRFFARKDNSAADAGDFYPTPPWATKAFIDHVGMYCIALGGRCLEPACGAGDMSKVLINSGLFESVTSRDKFDRGYGEVSDFLQSDEKFDWIITNPPYSHAEEFLHHALKLAEIGVAILVRTTFLEGTNRYNRLFNENPPSIIAQYSQRVTMMKNVADDHANGGAVPYCWLVWIKNRECGTRFIWIPPCKEQYVGG